MGGDGNDVLTGGTSDDLLSGGAGDDVYRFAKGDGTDTIDNQDAVSTNDRLTFESGIDHDDLWFRQEGDDLLISVLGTSDKVRVKDWFDSDAQKLDTIVARDGWTLSQGNDLNALVNAMVSWNAVPGDPAVLYNDNIPGNVKPTMASSWHSPT